MGYNDDHKIFRRMTVEEIDDLCDRLKKEGLDFTVSNDGDGFFIQIDGVSRNKTI